MQSLTLRLPTPEAKRLRALAKYDGRTLSSFARIGLQRFMDELTKGDGKVPMAKGKAKK